jgi:hypothetical protein
MGTCALSLMWLSCTNWTCTKFNVSFCTCRWTKKIYYVATCEAWTCPWAWPICHVGIQ